MKNWEHLFGGARFAGMVCESLPKKDFQTIPEFDHANHMRYLHVAASNDVTVNDYSSEGCYHDHNEVFDMGKACD